MIAQRDPTRDPAGHDVAGGTPVLLALGSNLGDRRAHLAAGLESLAEHVRIEAVSRVVESEPLGPIPQGRYLNLVVRGRTPLAPPDLLRVAHAAEAKAGRVREARYGPRTLDVDLLFFGDVASDAPELTLPHPHWRERPFVYALLHEVAGDVTDPRTGVRIADLVPAGPLPESLCEVEPISSAASGWL